MRKTLIEGDHGLIVSFREDDGDVVFELADSPEHYRAGFQSAFYALEGGVYVKRFPIDTPGIEAAKINFQRCAETMFAQLSGASETLWEEALLEFIKRTEHSSIDWWLTGSCAMCARGIPVVPHDVDIMLNSADIEEVNEIFSDCIVEPIRSSKGWVVNYFGVLFIQARVDLAFDPEDFVDHPEPADFGPYARRHLEWISWKGHCLRVPPLGLQLSVNRRRRRMDRVRLIEDHLRVQKPTEEL